MALIVQCVCGAKLQAKPELVGKRVKCPSCGKPLIVAAPKTAAPKPTGQKTAAPLSAAKLPGAGQPSELDLLQQAASDAGPALGLGESSLGGNAQWSPLAAQPKQPPVPASQGKGPV